MRLAIVGSRILAAHPQARPLQRRLIEQNRPSDPSEDYVILSGGAVGIDRMVVEEARALGVYAAELRPGGSGWRFYQARNLRLAQACDKLIRVTAVDATTYGSGWTRDRAREMGKPTEEYRL